MTSDWTNRPNDLRQIADELDDGRDTSCSEALICREAAAEIERLRDIQDMLIVAILTDSWCFRDTYVKPKDRTKSATKTRRD